MTWRDGLVERVTVYSDIDEARAAAERLAEERGQAITQENLENLQAYLDRQGQVGFEGFGGFVWLFDPDCAFEDTVLPDSVGETYCGHEGVIRAGQNWAGAYESLLVELEEIVPVGDRLVSIHRVHAKARRTGIEFEGPVAYVWTFRGGKVIHFRGYANPKRALKAAGLEP